MTDVRWVEGSRDHLVATHGPRLVLIEDDPGDALLVRAMLEEAWGTGLELRHIECIADLDDHLASWAECLIVDLSLPDGEGLDAFEAVRDRAPDTPLVVLTGREDEEIAIATMKVGAQDFLTKAHVDAYALRRAVAYAQQRKSFEAELVNQALHDPLTGLPNRRLFCDRLGTVLRQQDRDGVHGAVLFLDLDRFKTLNDSHGHQIGDQLIRLVADRLRSALRPGDTVARFGGDEFVVLLESVRDAAEAIAAAARLASAVGSPAHLSVGDVFVRASVGVALIEAGDDADTLLRKADAAMYAAKARGGPPHMFETGLRDRALRRLETEHELHRAVERGDFHVLYQPVVNVDSGLILGAEALVRWRHASRGTIAPDHFIALAEETGLIVSIDRQVLAAACAARATWPTGHPPGAMHVAVNLSMRDLVEPDLADRVAVAIAEAGLMPTQVCLELTETVLMADAEMALAAVGRLRDIGVALAIDDFGTGYSSLAYLKKFPVDILKLDRSIIDEVGESSRDQEIVGAMVTMAHGMGLRVVAEGVETEAQLAALRRLECDDVQGYLTGRPCSADDFDLLLARG